MKDGLDVTTRFCVAAVAATRPGVFRWQDPATGEIREKRFQFP